MSIPNSPFAKLVPGSIQALPETASQGQSWHQWSKAEIDALTAAYAARRPLLVRGEPGTGKTQLARAAAEYLGWRLHAETIHPRFEPTDLLYRFDAVKRLADAQIRKEGALEDETRYWRPGVLWKAYGWQQATPYLPEVETLAAPEGHVVLIDEIDKADSDLPNSLLEVLAQRSFHVEPLKAAVGGPRAQAPLIVITTNEERELPAAFLRRCVVLSLAAEPDYANWLVQRGHTHFGALDGVEGREQARISPAILSVAADLLLEDRTAVAGLELSKPGLAEYLDILYALDELHGHVKDPATRTGLQEKDLLRLSAYTFLKHAVEDSNSPANQAVTAKKRSNPERSGS